MTSRYSRQTVLADRCKKNGVVRVENEEKCEMIARVLLLFHPKPRTILEQVIAEFSIAQYIGLTPPVNKIDRALISIPHRWAVGDKFDLPFEWVHL